MMRTAALLLALASLDAQAECLQRDDTTKAAYAAATVAHAIDWGQTRTIAANPDRWQEMNPFLGRNPSASQVNRYFAALVLFEGAMYCFASDDIARNALTGIAIVSWIGVTHNHVRAGVRISF